MGERVIPAPEATATPGDARAARWIGLAGAKLGFLGVAAGAFGAHALKHQMVPAMLEVYDTAARYQIVHALALVLTALGVQQRGLAPWRAAGWLFVIGTVLFSGSLYALSLTQRGMWGAVTPVGGVCLLVGWACLAIGWWRGR